MHVWNWLVITNANYQSLFPQVRTSFKFNELGSSGFVIRGPRLNWKQWDVNGCHTKCAAFIHNKYQNLETIDQEFYMYVWIFNTVHCHSVPSESFEARECKETATFKTTGVKVLKAFFKIVIIRYIFIIPIWSPSNFYTKCRSFGYQRYIIYITPWQVDVKQRFQTGITQS